MSSEIIVSGADLVVWWGRQSALARVSAEPDGVKDPVHVWKFLDRNLILKMTVNILLVVGSGKLINNPDIYVFRKSDRSSDEAGTMRSFAESNNATNQRSLWSKGTWLRGILLALLCS